MERAFQVKKIIFHNLRTFCYRNIKTLIKLTPGRDHSFKESAYSKGGTLLKFKNSISVLA